MYKLFAIFLIGFLASESMAMSPRLRRQAVASSTAAPSTAASQASGQNVDMQQCLLTCPVTAEYNPVCGSNGVTYSNPGRLLCAQACGENISLQRTAPCPRT
ncbi:PREDICTED: uncharacterized protein LOC106103038 [Papilio polytes]|uniref:uncharacterized protein LOC106103038 n=1 Tax=Papilio polytes TaxID=76194 RepID=UPI000676623B|nr:PREDICTED: uncharacterized protein LOC106103038 [Papilio polytes]